jgi:hypothetical protein
MRCLLRFYCIRVGYEALYGGLPPEAKRFHDQEAHKSGEAACLSKWLPPLKAFWEPPWYHRLWIWYLGGLSRLCVTIALERTKTLAQKNVGLDNISKDFNPEVYNNDLDPGHTGVAGKLESTGSKVCQRASRALMAIQPQNNGLHLITL